MGTHKQNDNWTKVLILLQIKGSIITALIINFYSRMGLTFP